MPKNYIFPALRKIAQEKVASRFDLVRGLKIEKPDILQSFINRNLTQEEPVSASLLLAAYFVVIRDEPRKLVYLQGVILEGLRMTLQLGVSYPRRLPQKLTQLMVFLFPEGTISLPINTWVPLLQIRGNLDIK